VAKTREDIPDLVVADMLFSLIVMSILHPSIVRNDSFVEAVDLFGILIEDLLSVAGIVQHHDISLIEPATEVFQGSHDGFFGGSLIQKDRNIIFRKTLA